MTTGKSDKELFVCAYPEYQELRPDSTFWDDFSLADAFGRAAIKDTFDRAFDGWKKDAKMFAELTAILNHKIWYWWHKGNIDVSKLYDELWRKTDEYWKDNFKDEELNYIWHVLD